MNVRRQEISDLLDAKFKVSDICKILDCDKNRVYDVIKLKKLGLSLKPKYARGKRTVRTEEFTEGIWSVCCSDPSMKMDWTAWAL